MKSILFLAVLVAAEPTWQTFTSKTGKYSVSLPTKVQERAQMTPEGTYYTVETQLNADARLKCYFYEMDLSEDQLKQEGVKDRVLEGARDQIVKEAKGKLGKEMKIEIDGHPGREFEMEVDRAAGRVRIFLVDKRFYGLVVVGKGMKSEGADKFLKSFKLTD